VNRTAPADRAAAGAARSASGSGGPTPAPVTIAGLAVRPPGAPDRDTYATVASGQIGVTEPDRILYLAAETPRELADLLAGDDATLRAASLTGAENPAGCRLAIAEPTARRIALARSVTGTGTPLRGRNDVWFSPAPLLTAGGKLGYVFPGLEADFTPRADDLAAVFGTGAVRHDRLAAPSPDRPELGWHGLAVITLGRLLDRALRALRIPPDAVAGHSVGEWTAMVAAGLYAAEEADAFLDRFDPSTLEVPGMVFAVLGCGAERASGALARHPDVVLSHDNSPNQSIVCGPASAVDPLVAELRADGVLGQLLPFRSGFHSPMLAPHLEPIRRSAEAFALHPARVPIWSATTAAPYPTGEAAVRALFLRHLLEPVRFRQLITAMYAAGFRVFVQVGTGQLGSLVDDTLRGADHLSIAANVPQRSGLAQLRRVAAAIWVEGGQPDLTVLRPAPMVSGAAGLVDSGGLDCALSELDGLAVHRPALAELNALLRETADSCTAVLRAAAGPAPVRLTRRTLRVSTSDLPYLVDHCLFRQRDGWPDETDRWPVVPGTTMIQLAGELAEQARPGHRAIGVRDVALRRWLVAAPAQDVELTTQPAGPDTLTVHIGQYASITVELAAAYQAEVPTEWRLPADEREPEIAAGQLYTDRWMFHGPAFQGVTELTAIGARHLRAVITTPPAPGALLDNVGQLLGYWIAASRPTRRLVFPIGVDRIRYFGPHPAIGTRLRCLIVIAELTDNTLRADTQLILPDGAVWAEITGWRDRRFDSCPETLLAERFPEHGTLSQEQPGGWTLLYDRWPDPSSRDLLMRNQLCAAEREALDRQPPRLRPHWVLGRIAAKDAVRRLLWTNGAGPVFPAEVEISGDQAGQPRATGKYGLRLPPVDVTIAHCPGVAVAAARVRPAGARPGRPGIGIDVREITGPPDTTADHALSPAERELLAATVRVGGSSAAVESTRFWAAKQAAARAEGPGDRPRRLVVLDASRTELLVGVADQPGLDPADPAPVPGRRYRVRTQTLHTPDEPRPRRYVVAWTVDGPASAPGRSSE
jgi:malonyl CoA-acyl carrier protein transacylase